MKKLLKLLVFTTLLSCNSQTKNNKETIEQTIKKEQIMQPKDSITRKNSKEKLNIKKYNEEKGKQGYDDEYHFELDDKTKIRQYYSEKYYEVRKKENFPISENIVYYKNGNVHIITTNFNRDVISFQKQYNDKGELIKETNYDLPFKLSFDDIRKIVFKTKKVDIFDTRQAVALRHTGNPETALPLPYYQIFVLKQHPNGDLEPISGFLLDAETGEEFNPEKEAREKNLFKSYNGKDYTEEEWETFEKTDEYKTQYKKGKEEWDKKSFWDKLSGN
ncbi:MAG: hypothetical protein JKY08_10035 [Flavobacteriaceae bacterium]|nr:hypothetical protein [Flavobacteriaceae bacterium]